MAFLQLRNAAAAATAAARRATATTPQQAGGLLLSSAAGQQRRHAGSVGLEGGVHPSRRSGGGGDRSGEPARSAQGRPQQSSGRGGGGGGSGGTPAKSLREFAAKPNLSNKVRMVRDGWDEHDPRGRLLKSVRNGRTVYSAEDVKRESAKLFAPATAASSSSSTAPASSKPSTSQSYVDSHVNAVAASRDPWKPDENGVWYSAITQQPISQDRYIVYPGNKRRVDDVLREMDAGNIMHWRPKRNRRTVIILDSKWSGWHEVQWDGVVIKTIRERGAPHPEKPESLEGSVLRDEYLQIRKKMAEQDRETTLGQLAKEEAAAKAHPPKDDLEFDGKKLITLVNSSDNMLTRAYIVFKFMERKNLVATSVTFNSLLQACVNTCQFELGLNVWRMMLARGVMPDLSSYNALMQLSNRSGNRNFVFKVYQEMLDFGLSPDRSTFNTLIQSDKNRGFALVQEWAKKGHDVPPSVLLRMYSELSNPEKAFKLWKTMQNSRNPPSTEDYNHMLLLCERCGEHDKATELFDHMEERSVAPNFLTYNTIMNMLAINGDVEKLHKVQAMMHDRKVTTLVVLSTFRFAGADTSIINGVNMDLSVSIDVPTFDGEQDVALSVITQQMVQHLEHKGDYQVNLKGLPTYTLLHLGHEYYQRASLQFHCEKKSLSFLLLKHGRTPDDQPPKQIPRINVNARMCMDCHAVFASASKEFRVRLECNDHHTLHVFDDGEDLSTPDGWRNTDANNVPGSGQFGGGL